MPMDSRGALVVLGALLSTALSVAQEGGGGAPRAFSSAAGGGFAFDTGALRGRPRAGGRSLGLSSVVHVPTGAALDKGEKGYGIFSHYRVFSAGKRYGGGAWDWPGGARLLGDGAVEVHWKASEDRPFEMKATYRWAAPDALDLTTEVRALKPLQRFESFLASYFAASFDRSMAYVRDLPGGPGFMAAEKSAGDWQMFPRDTAAVEVINDGRWRLPPHPVAWAIMPVLERPLAVRRDAKSGLAVALMADPKECFAVAMPHQAEGHYSVYLSLFGRDLAEGESASARARIVVGKDVPDGRVLEWYRSFAGGDGR